MELSHKESAALEVVPLDEFQRDPDAYIALVKQEKRPIRIREQDGKEVVLLSWEHHQELFGERYEAYKLAEITEVIKSFE